MYAVPGNDGFDERVKSVAGLLRLLDSIPAAEPPADLIVRTMQRIEQRTYAPRAAAPAPSQSAQADPRRPA